MKCGICGIIFELDKDARWEMESNLYSVLTTFSSENEDCEIKSKRMKICSDCSHALHYIIEEQLKPRINGRCEHV